MTEEWGPRTEPGGDRQAAPVAAVLDIATDEEAPRGGTRARVAAGVVGALLLIGGTLFAVTRVSGSDPETAEAAVSELLDAAADEDVLGVMAALDPDERETLRGPAEDLFGELQRLEVLDESFRLDGIAGVDLEFHDLSFRTEVVRDGLARVYLTGGTVTTAYDADQLPIGDFVSDTIGRFGGDISGMSETETKAVVADDADPEFLVARRGVDGWRVSIAYTVAEHARDDAGAPVPDPALAITPLGATSPEAAVEGMARAAADLDLRGVIARLAPGELGALQEYAGLFIDDAERSLAEEAGDTEITLGDLDLRSHTDGDRASVFVDGFSLTAAADGTTIGIRVTDSCVTLTGDVDELAGFGFGHDGQPVCADELPSLFGSAFTGVGLGASAGSAPAFPPMEAPSLAITTVRHDGGWYVAPVQSALDTVVAGLRVLDRSHLEAAVDIVEAMLFSFSDGFSSEFSEVGTEIGTG